MGMFDGIVVTDIESAFTVVSSENRHETVYDRKFYGLSFCLEGQITYTHNGNEYISDKNSVVILPKGQTYTLVRNRNGIFPVINFDTLMPLCTTHCIIPIDDAAPLFADFSIIRSCLHSEKDRARAMSVFYGIIHRLSSNMIDLGVIAPAVEYMRQNYNRAELNNSLIADECGISEVYLRKRFLEKLGVTPRQYLIDLRLARARELLSDCALKISVIAEICGFTNPYHFTRTFKEKTGITPGEYMRKSRVYKL